MRRVIIAIVLTILIINNIVYSAPSISAQSAVLMDVETKRVLFEQNAHVRLPMASTTKIMTALVALEKGNIHDIVEIDKDVVGI